ncbi:ATP-binding protein [Kribbella sp. NPDC051586]|uniref:ATP-binding protein n=1 Tax=Kribbella sp. NPDC051586 TaxID=3364118 RepID=UPI0037AA306A
MSQVFGTVRHPASVVTRTDRLGNTVSLGDVLPESKAILFTGPPGMGKTSELDRAEDLAERNGWTAIRMTASGNMPLEHQLTGAVRASLDDLRARFRRGPVRKLGKTVRDLTQSGRNTRLGVEGRLGGGILPVELVGKSEKDTTAHDNLGTTLNDFADELGRLTAIDDKPILLLVDNIDQASEADRAGLNELAIHIEELNRPVWLVAAGGAMSTSALMNASRRMSGIATTISNQFDIRELGPLSDAQVWPALTEPLDRAGIPYEYAAVDRLVTAANGDPTRLRQLSEAAVAHRDPDAGITVGCAQAATARINADAAVLYQSVWDQKRTSHAQKDLLAHVAAQGPNGLYMPDETQAAGPGRWQEIDQARQELVARGLLREHSGHVVTIPDKGLQDWVNDYLGQTPVAAAPPTIGQALSRDEAALAPAHPIGERALVNQVFGAGGELVHRVERSDEQGRPISLEDRPPKGTSVLFTGPPGMGTSQELNRTKAMADAEGWIAIRLDASRRESLEARVIRAVQGELGTIKERFPAGQVKELKQLLNRMAIRTKNSMNTAQVRIGIAPGPKIGFHTAWEGVTKDSVGTTLNEVAEHLGKMAMPTRQPILLMVDNLDAASKNDLVALTELSAHLQRVRQPMFLIAAGGEEATSRLLEASGGHSGMETKQAGKFDVRRLTPLSENELRPALTVPLDAARVRYEPAAVDSLVTAANGNPSRLRTLAAAALELSEPGSGITAEVAATATARLNAQSRALYDAAWYNCTPTEKELLAKTAAHGSHGMQTPSRSEAAGPDRWDLDSAAQKLVSRGLLTRTGHQIRVADPGFQDWVQTRLGVSAAQAGLARPVAGQAQLGSAGARPAHGQGGPRREDLQAKR